MSQYRFLKQADGQVIKVLTDDDGIIQISSNGTDYSNIEADAPGVVATVTGDFVDNTDPENPIIDAADAVTSAMIQDSSVSTAKIQDGAVTEAKITSTDWFEQVRKFVVAKDATIVTTVLADDCQTELPNFVFSETSSGVTEIATGATGGQVAMSPGSTAGSTTRVKNLGSVALVANARTTHWAIATRIKSNAPTPLGTATQRLVNMSDDSTYSVMVCIDRSVSTTNYTAEIGSDTAADTGVTIDSSYHTWILINDGTTCKAYHNFNTTAVASSASTVIASAEGHLSLLGTNGDQNTAFTMSLDKVCCMTENP